MEHSLFAANVAKTSSPHFRFVERIPVVDKSVKAKDTSPVLERLQLFFSCDSTLHGGRDRDRATRCPYLPHLWRIREGNKLLPVVGLFWEVWDDFSGFPNWNCWKEVENELRLMYPNRAGTVYLKFAGYFHDPNPGQIGLRDALGDNPRTLSIGRNLGLLSDRKKSASSKYPLASHLYHLASDKQKSTDADSYSEKPDASEGYVDPKSSFIPTVFLGGFDDPYIGVNVLLMFGLEGWAVSLLWRNGRNWRGWLVACGGMLCLIRLGVSLHREDSEKDRETRQHFLHDSEIVPQKTLDFIIFSGYSYYMANVLNTDKQIAVIGALAEGNSIRSIERMTGIHRDTIMRLGVKVGQGCTAMMDETMRDLTCQRLELDEIWGYIGKKENHLIDGDHPEFGNVWTWCAIDADTKLVPAFRVGKRERADAIAFVRDVSNRMRSRVQISTDGLNAYVDAMERAFGGDVDYGQVIKTYGVEEVQGQRRYSQPEVTAIEKKIVSGNPRVDLISTSYVERLNATTRLHMKRLARLTHAFSKKRDNFEAAVGLHFAYYNFVRRHNTLRCTPAMAAGVASSFWSVGDLLEAAA